MLNDQTPPHKRTLNHDDFVNHFAQFGKIEDAVVSWPPDWMKRVLRSNPSTIPPQPTPTPIWPPPNPQIVHREGVSRGFGFITYSDEIAVEKCLVVAHYIGGKKVELKRAIPKEEMEAAEAAATAAAAGPDPLSPGSAATAGGGAAAGSASGGGGRRASGSGGPQQQFAFFSPAASAGFAHVRMAGGYPPVSAAAMPASPYQPAAWAPAGFQPGFFGYPAAAYGYHPAAAYGGFAVPYGYMPVPAAGRRMSHSGGHPVTVPVSAGPAYSPPSYRAPYGQPRSSSWQQQQQHHHHHHQPSARSPGSGASDPARPRRSSGGGAGGAAPHYASPQYYSGDHVISDQTSFSYDESSEAVSDGRRRDPRVERCHSPYSGGDRGGARERV
jgi:hypothetical protein